jgi:hypothetical protein
MWVAVNMVKPAEVGQILEHNWFHGAVMFYTAGALILPDFLTGVSSAMVLDVVQFKVFDKPRAEHPAVEPRGVPCPVAVESRELVPSSSGA